MHSHKAKFKYKILGLGEVTVESFDCDKLFRSCGTIMDILDKVYFLVKTIVDICGPIFNFGRFWGDVRKLFFQF